MNRLRFRLLILAAAFALSLPGCSFTYHIDPGLLPAPQASAMVRRWPLGVGLYISPQVRSREFSREAAHVPAGGEVASTFHWAVSQLFSEVVLLEVPPGAQGIPAGLAGAIELADIDLHEGDAPIRYDILLHSARGRTADKWPLFGTASLWDGERSSLSATLQNIGTALSYGIRNQTARFMVELPTQNAVQQWLAQAGIDPAPPRPHGARQPGETRDGDRLMILPDVASWRYTDNLNAMDCVGNRLRAYLPPVDVVVMDNAARLDFFPWFEPSTGPGSVEALRGLLAQPAIADKLRELRVRYLMTFEGGTTMAVPRGGILCGGGGPAGGCFGFAWGSRDSSFSATLIDLYAGREPESFVAKESSGVYVPAFVLPLPLLAPTESVACERLARDLYEIMTKAR